MTQPARFPHFFLAHSRLGLFFPPNRSTIPNIGVEEGPTAVLQNLLNEPVPKKQQTRFIFPTPEEVKKELYLAEEARYSTLFAEVINHHLQPDETQVVIGGDHSVSLGSMAAVLKRFSPEKVSAIMFDSHGDLHLSSTSPSGNFHGMWYRSVVDHFDQPEVDAVVKRKLNPDHITFIGNLDIEEEEERFIHQHHIPVFRDQDIRHHQDQVLSHLKEKMSRFEHLHISFDIDVFDFSLVKATGTPNMQGLQKSDVFPFLELLREHPSLSIDLVEVNPKKEGAAETIALAQEVLRTLLK